MSRRRKRARKRSFAAGATWHAVHFYAPCPRRTHHELRAGDDVLIEVLVFPVVHEEYGSRYLLFVEGYGFLRTNNIVRLKQAKELAERAVLHLRKHPGDRTFTNKGAQRERHAFLS